MADVKLVLTADNTQYVNKIKEAQQTTQKLYDTSVSGARRNKGILEEIDTTLAKLEKAKRKAFSYEDIERYNKKIQETKLNLQEYEQAGLKVEKRTESLTAIVTKWVAGLGLAATALNLLQKALLATESGMAAVAISTAALEKVFSNLVNNGIFNLNKGLAETILRTKQLHELNRQELIDKYEQAKLQRQYNELLYQAADQTKTNTERIALFNKAIEVNNKIIDEQIVTLQKRLKIAIDAWKDDPTNGTMRDEVIKLKTELEELDTERVQATRRVVTQLTGLVEQEKKVWENTIKSIHDGLDKAVKEELSNREKWFKAYFSALKNASDQQAKDSKAWQDAFYKGELDVAKKQKQNKEDEWDSLMDLYRDQFAQRQAMIDANTKAEEEKKRESERTKLELQALTYNESIRLALIASDLVGTVIDNQYNKELAILERKKLMLLDIASINGLTKQEEIDIYERVEREKLEIERKYSKQRQRLAIAQATIDAAATIVKVFLEYKGTPLAFVVAGLVAAQLATQIAIIKAQKFAKGGWTGDGGEKDETGERVAGVVHEKEFVVKRGQASKYREVLEAINKEDRSKIYSSFLKLQPEVVGSTVNNVTVENNGPNNRLDRINNQLYQLNRTLTPKKIHREEVIIGQGETVIRHGQNIRTIKR